MNQSTGFTRASIWVVWLLSGLVALAAILVGINIFLFLGNRSIQAETHQRQQYINETIRLNQLNNQLIQSLVSLSAQGDDQQLRNMLAANGVTFVINQPAKSQPGPSENGDKQDGADQGGAATTETN